MGLPDRRNHFPKNRLCRNKSSREPPLNKKYTGTLLNGQQLKAIVSICHAGKKARSDAGIE
jgi:hypothetical protein